MKVIQAQFTVNGKAYQVVGVAETANAIVDAVQQALPDIPLDNIATEILWDSTTGFTYDALKPLLTCARDGADASWLPTLVQNP